MVGTPVSDLGLWAEVLVSRTLRADRWWRAEPEDAGSGTVRGLWQAASGSGIKHHLELKDRFVLSHSTDGRIFVGLATMAGKLNPQYACDADGRPLPVMAGWLSQSHSSAVPEFRYLEKHSRTWAAPLMKNWLYHVWDRPEGARLSHPEPSPYKAPPWNQGHVLSTSAGNRSDSGSRPEPGHVCLWPESEAGQLWDAVAGERNDSGYVLVTGWTARSCPNLTAITHMTTADALGRTQIPIPHSYELTPDQDRERAAPQPSYEEVSRKAIEIAKNLGNTTMDALKKWTLYAAGGALTCGGAGYGIGRAIDPDGPGPALGFIAGAGVGGAAGALKSASQAGRAKKRYARALPQEFGTPDSRASKFSTAKNTPEGRTAPPPSQPILDRSLFQINEHGERKEGK